MSEPGHSESPTPSDPTSRELAEQHRVPGLLDEQSRDWRRGQGLPVEAYLTRHPTLQSDPNGLLDLIYHEVVLRQQRGENPRLEEYLQRFPHHHQLLRKLFDLHGALEANQAALYESTVISSAGGAVEFPASEAPTERYQLLGEIGRGGVGAVLKGHDRTLRRDLAIKVLLGEHQDDPEARRRFLEEAQIGGQLQHPGVVPVHEVGCFPDGRPWFSMKLVQGQTLAALLEQRASPAEDLPRFLLIFEQVCQAVAYAHSQGVIHRDLKPQNVMVGAFGEVQVMDWGLAKVLTEVGEDSSPPTREILVPPLERTGGDGETPAGWVLGTPAYMAPEQARGEVARLDERCDVFGLGAILCVILTGQPPFVTTSQAGVYPQAVRGDLTDALARLDGCGADGELIGIARDCLAPRPDDRPRDAGEVAARVTGYRAGVQERLRAAELERAAAEAKAAEAGAKVRVERRARRLTAGLAAAGLLLLALVGGGAWWLQRAQAATERDVTAALEKAKERLDRARAETDDPEKWRATLQEASAAVGQAEGVLASGAATKGLTERVRQARAAVERANADRQLLVDLDDIRLAQTESKDGLYDFATAAPRYASVFAGYGMDVPTLEVSEVAERLRAHPFRDRLVAALEEWARVTPVKGDQAKLRRVWEAVEDEEGSFRRRWRAALERRDRAALDRLVEEVEAGALSPAAVVSVERSSPKSERERLLRAGQRRYPADFWINHELAHLLHDSQPPQVEAAVGFYRAALALRSRVPGVHNNLGSALTRTGQHEEAIRCFRRALELNPNLAKAHLNLGVSLRATGHTDEAIRSYRRALELDPGYAMAYNNLGNALQATGQRDEAVRCFRRAIELDPGYASPHCNLGHVLRHLRKYEEAISHYQKAIAIQPGFAEAHFSLGLALQSQGRFAEALRHLQRGHELGSRKPGWRSPSLQRVRHCQRLLQLQARLPDLLAGKIAPASAAEGIGYAELCVLTRRPAIATRLYTDAFTADPRLADDLDAGYRYDAACAAALAAAGQGTAPTELADKERARLRRQALDWLRAELVLWAKREADGGSAQRAAVQKGLRHWQQDSDLASVRDQQALARLATEERVAWERLWADVDALLGRIQRPK
jgi:serine/threonine-protein kinase